MIQRVCCEEKLCGERRNRTPIPKDPSAFQAAIGTKPTSFTRRGLELGVPREPPTLYPRLAGTMFFLMFYLHLIILFYL